MKSKFKSVTLLISLLLVLLFSAGFVSATLTVKNVVGSSGINNYRAVNDTIGINVTSSSNVSMNGVLCIKQGTTTYICTATDVASVAKAVYQLSNTEGDSVAASINVDNNIGSITYVINTQNGASLDYDVKDLGFNNNNVCSGISSINVYDGSSLLNTVDINSAPGTCNYVGSINLSIRTSGTKSISLEVIDNVGNKKKSTPQTIVLDISAPEVINGLIVKYAGRDEELSVIGGNAQLFVDLYFKIREDNLANIYLDLSEANINPAVQYAYKNIDLSLSNCVSNDSTTGTSVKVYDCYIKSVPLKLSANTLNMGVTVIDSFGNNVSTKLSKTFTIDNVQPIVAIKTEACDGVGKCYIHNGVNNIIVSMNKNNFNNKYLFLNVPGSTFGISQVQNCTESECVASVLLTCDSGSTINVAIASFGGLESQDDAGNIVAPYNVDLYCDDNDPSIKNITVTGENPGSVIKEIVSGSTITVTAQVVEPESDEIIALAHFGKAKNVTEEGTCTKTSNYDFNCVWVVSNIDVGYYETTVLVNITDVIGNTVSKQSNKFMVLGFKSDNETPTNINIRLNKLYPEELNRIVVDMATYNGLPYYIYATYDLSAIERPGQTVKVLHQQTDIGKCNYIGSIGTSSASQIFSVAEIIDPYADLNKKGKLGLKFQDGFDPNSLDDTFIISCNISVIVKEGNYIYGKTQELQLDMSFIATNSKLCKLGEDCTPGAVFGEKIKDAENGFFVKLKIMGQIDAIIPKIQSMCKLREYISTASFLNNAIGAAASVIDLGVGVGGGNGLAGNIAGKSVNIGVKLNTLDQCLFGSRVKNPGGQDNGVKALDGKIVESANGQKRFEGYANIQTQEVAAEQCAGFIGQMCDMLTCSLTDNITSNAIPDLSTGTGVVDFMNRSVEPDVGNSIFAAFQAKCWPAVYYNFNKWRQTDCNYLYCLKIASYTGTDISACDKTKFAQQCMIVTGTLYEAIPKEATKYVDNAADLVNSGLPLMAASWGKKLLCPEYLDFSTGSAGKVTYGGDVDEKGKPIGAMCQGDTGEAKVCNAKKIFLCQIPLQVARFADMQTRAKQSQQFVYPSLPDMCTIANCFGKENCQYEPDIFKTMNQMNLPAGGNKINRDRNNEVTLMNYNLGTLRQTMFEQQVAYNAAVIDYDKKQEIMDKSMGEKLSEDILIIEKDRNDAKTARDNALKSLTDSYKEADRIKDCISTPSCDMATLLKNKDSSGIVNTANVDEYATMSASEQLRFDQAQARAYQRLDELYSDYPARLAEYKKKYPQNKGPYTGLEGLTEREQEELTAIIKEYDLEMDNGVLYTTDRRVEEDSGLTLYSKLSREKLQDLIKNQEELVKNKGRIVRTSQAAEQFGSVMLTALQFLNANHMIDWMFGDYWVEKIFGKDAMAFLDKNKLIESICNPNSVVSISDEVEGNVISCASGLCLPVLTYATERANLEYPNGTKYYIYSVVYYISPGDMSGEDVSYNVYFNGFGAKSMYGYLNNIELKSYQIKHVQRAFQSPNKYTEMCVKFTDEFPQSNQILGMAKEEYCRDIKESGTWNTGSPWVPPEEEGFTDEDSTPEFDEQGRRITATTSVNAAQPGVLEG